MVSIDEVKSIFGRALEIPESTDRAAFLQQACGGNVELRAQVEKLLAALADAGHFMNRPEMPSTVAAHSVQSAELGLSIGPYKLLQKLGEGGMGTVYLAEQVEPVKRQVAVKVIKAGMDSGQIIVRFEQERQALAMMDHPNIG